VLYTLVEHPAERFLKATPRAQSSVAIAPVT
jgi:hypothetical protein